MLTEDDRSAIAWLLDDADRCASIVADAYDSWDGEQPWMDALLDEIDHRRGPEEPRDDDESFRGREAAGYLSEQQAAARRLK